MKTRTILILFIILIFAIPVIAENTSLTGMKLSNASPEDRIRIRELLKDYKDARARSGPAYSHFIMGRIYTLTKQFEEARKIFQKIIDYYGHTKWASVAREAIAESWVLEGKPEKALKEYDDYLENWKVTSVRKKEIIYRIATLYSQKLSKFESIMKAYKTVASHPEYNRDNYVRFLGGFFKGYHLLKAHYAVKYFEILQENWKDSVEGIDARFNLGLIFGYDLSDYGRAIEYFQSIIEDEKIKEIERKREAILLRGLINQFHLKERDAVKCIPYYMTLAMNDGTDEIRSASLFFLGKFFEDSYEFIEFNRKLEEIPDADTNTVLLRDKYLEDDISPVNKAFYLYMTALRETDNEFFASMSAYRASTIMAYYHNKTEPVEFIGRYLAKRFPDSDQIKKIEEIYKMKMPRIYDPGFEAMFAEATNLYEERLYEKAIDKLREIVIAAGNSYEAEWAHFTIGRIYEEDLQDYIQAISVYNSFLDDFPNSSKVWKIKYQVGRIYELYLLDYTESRMIYEDIIENSTEQMWIFQAGLDLARLQKEVFNKKKENEKIFKMLLDKVPARRDEILYRLAKLKIEKKKNKDADELLLEIIEKYPDSEFFEPSVEYIVKDRIRSEFKKLDQVISRKSKDTGEVFLLLGQKLDKQLQLGDYEDAFKTVEKLIKTRKDTEEINLLKLKRAEIFIKIGKDYKKGIKAALEVFKNSEDQKTKDEAMFIVGNTYEKKLKDWVKAGEAYDILIDSGKTDKPRMMALYRRGVIAALREKDFDKAYDIYRELIIKYPELAKKEGVTKKVKALLNIDISMLMLGDFEGQAEAILDFDTDLSIDTDEINLSDTGETELLGDELTIEDAKPSVSHKLGNWFKPFIISKFREGNTWFAKIDDGERSFWDRKKIHRGWFEIRKYRGEWDRGSFDDEILRQEQVLEKLEFESNLPPVRSPKSVYYLDYLKEQSDKVKRSIVLFYLGKSYEESQDLKRASKIYNQIIDEYSDTAESNDAALSLVDILAGSGEFVQAYEKIEESFKKGIINSSERQNVKKKLKSWEKVNENEKYIDNHPGEDRSVELINQTSRIYEKELKDYDSAVALLNRGAALTAGETIEINFKKEIVRIKKLQKDYDGVDEEYTDIIAKFKDMEGFDDILMEYVTFLLKVRKNEERAILYLKEIVDFYPDSKHFTVALEKLSEIIPEENLSERKTVYEALLSQSPELHLETKYLESLSIISVKEKIENIYKTIRELIKEADGNKPGPEVFMYYKYIIRLYERELKDKEMVVKILKEMIDLGPPDSIMKEAILKLGNSLVEDRKKKEAALLYREKVKNNFDSDPKFAAYLQYLSAKTFEEAGKYDEADDGYRKTVLYFPFSKWASSAKIAINSMEDRKKKRIKIKKPSKKEPEFKLPVKKRKTDEITLKFSDEVKISEKDKKKTPEQLLEEIYKEIEKDDAAEKVPGLLIKAAKLEEKLKNEEKMMENYKTIIEKFPQYRDYYNIVYMIAESYKKAGNKEEAIPYYKKIVDEQPQFRNTEYVQFTLGKLYVETEEFIYAQEIFRALIDQYQDEEYSKEAQFLLGIIREVHLNEYDEAIEEYKKMADIYFDHPKAVDAQMRIGYIYENVKNEYANAKAAYQEVLDKFPDTGRRREVIDAIERMDRLLGN